ncbi:MAG: DUF1552 domain-containing protein [Myxococcota bacterium]
MRRGQDAREKKRISRRSFLRGAGGVLVSLPLLESLAPRPARAASNGPIKRFVVFFNPNGVIPQAFYPTPGSSETDFTINTCHVDLAPLRSKIIWTTGIDMKSGKAGPGERHQTGMGTLLTGRPLLPGNFVGGDGSLAGWGSGISVDQVIAQNIGRDSPIPSLQLGVRASGAEVRHRLSYLGPGQPLPPENDPRAVFDRLFSDNNTAPEEVRNLRRRRKSVLDAVIDQFGSVRRNIGKVDAKKLDAHLDLIRDVERRIDSMPVPGSCAAPARPVVDGGQLDSETTMPQLMDLQIDLLAVAFRCDLTRVASIQNSNAENHIRFPWLGSMGDGHSLSHAGPSSTNEANELILRDTWYAQKFFRLISALDGVTEGDKTILDNSVVLWGNELSIGNQHSQINMPFIIAGSGGGYFRTGRYVSYTNVSHVNMLVSFLNAMDIPATTFGDPQFCDGPLTNMT